MTAVRTRVFLVVVLLLSWAGASGAPTASAQPADLPNDPLRLATEVGRYLFAYDQAANRATTMLLSEGGDVSRVEASVIRQREGGRWTAGYGRLTEDGGFMLMHHVLLNEQRLVDEVRQGVDRRLPRSSYYARAVRAQRLVQRDLDGRGARTHGPYNLLVLPGGAEADHFTLYAVPAQTEADAYRFGGDYRYEVDPAEGQIVSQTPLHEQFYRVPPLADDAGGTAHEAVRPVETDVFFATVRRPAAPHFVVTGPQVYRVAPDGEITAVLARTFEGRDDVQMLSGE